MSADAASSWTPAGTAAAKLTRSTAGGGPCTPEPICSPANRKPGCRHLFTVDEHVEVEATWTIYQRTVAAYREHDRNRGRTMMQALINMLSTGVPKALQEVITLGRTLNKRATDILAYFDRPGTSHGPTEAINGPTRTPARLRPGLSQSHQLHRPITTGNRRIQTPTTPSTMKSPLR
jgi:hypothetical protein